MHPCTANRGVDLCNRVNRHRDQINGWWKILSVGFRWNARNSLGIVRRTVCRGFATLHGVNVGKQACFLIHADKVVLFDNRAYLDM